MVTVNVAEAKARFSEYLKRVERGETVVLARRNKPIAEIRPISKAAGHPRPTGLCFGEFQVPSDFDEPLPESVLEEFEG